MTNVVRNLPLNPNIALNGLASQETGLGTLNNNNQFTESLLAVVSQVQTPVTYTRSGRAVTHNPVNGDLTLREVDEPAFGDLGIQVGPTKANRIYNSDMHNGTTSYLTIDAGPIIVTAITESSGISESDTAFRLRLVNTTGVTQTVSVYQSISGLINEFWTAQIRYKIITSTGTPSAVVRVFDNTNAQITSSSPFELDISGRYHSEAATQQLVANSSDLRWELFMSLDNTEILEFYFTNTQLAISPWKAHYVPSVIPPGTRGADVIDVGISIPDTLFPFFSHATDQMWSVNFNTLGVLTTLPSTSQLQYIFSTYNGVDGTSLFVDDPNTITWRADFNGSFEDVTVTTVGLGDNAFRVFFRILTNGVNFDRQLFVESIVNGTIDASTVLTTPNLPITGDLLKLGRDDTDTNYFDGFIGNLMFWGNRSNLSMNRINTNWPT